MTYGTDSRKPVNDKMLLFAGDHRADNRVSAYDSTVTWNDRNLTGYLNADGDMNGTCNAADRAIVWQNRNLFVQIPEE